MVMVNDTGDAERASLSVVIDTTKASIARVYDAFLMAGTTTRSTGRS